MDKYLSAAGRGPKAWLLSRRGHVWTVVVLLALVTVMCVPVWGPLRAQVAERLPDTSAEAVTLGAAVGWTALTIGNLATVGVLMALISVVGAGLVRWVGGSGDFARARRGFALGWVAFVVLRAGGWLLLPGPADGEAAAAVPSVVRADAGVLLMLPLAVCVAWGLCELSLRRALLAGGALGGLFATSCLGLSGL
ncbi:hypothetical protein ACIPYS_09370 [Kitasatospora sp. NPDC089913]|uniref:hypothetical protein n=1 Tax=Kitasatospora sp. NPDC089913 TaxID=3364080 RepID=UPI00381945FE